MAQSSEPQSGNSRNGSDHQQGTMYDRYQKKFQSSDEKSSKGKFSLFKSSARGDPGSNNKGQDKHDPAASDEMANQAQNSSGGGSSSRWSRFPKYYKYPRWVHGFERDEMSLEIMLLEDVAGDSFKCIGVVGPPGVGKTTLCMSILKNKRVKDSYGHRIWVSLSKSSEEDEKPDPNEVELICGDEFSEWLPSLDNKLKEKKCLIVLDDVWEGEGEIYKDLKNCFSHDPDPHSRKKGGTVIVISRSEEVMVGEKLSFHPLMPLSDPKSCWSIYKDALDEMSLEIMLLEDVASGSLKSIGVVGPPRVGKTTLCMSILKNGKVKGRYDHMIWVSLSKSSENDEKPDPNEVELISGDEFSEWLPSLDNRLKEKKCLIVLDDVREGEEERYKDLQDCFSPDPDPHSRKKGGTVIVISKSKEAVKKVMVGEKFIYKDTLPEARATQEDDNNALKEVMKELMKKCGGLPGAAQLLGKIKAHR